MKIVILNTVVAHSSQLRSRQIYLNASKIVGFEQVTDSDEYPTHTRVFLDQVTWYRVRETPATIILLMNAEAIKYDSGPSPGP